MITRLHAKLRQRAADWIARRSPRQPGPVTLHRGRVYILPTRAGLYFGLLVFVMLLGSMNYSNSLGFTLSFLLAGLGLVCMHHTHRNLVNLRVDGGRQEPVFAGGHARFRLVLSNPSGTSRLALRIDCDEGEQQRIVDVPAGGEAIVQLDVPARRRGFLKAPRFRVHTEYPMGLFRTWSWANLDIECLVYPRPAGVTRLPAAAAGIDYGTAEMHGGQEDFAGLRRYEYGDPPRLIHWKAYPRSGQLLIKQFSDPRERELWLDWSNAPAHGPEARISQLCRWVIEAHRLGLTYGLRLPDIQQAPGTGAGHRDQCLRMLALFEPEGRTL